MASSSSTNDGRPLYPRIKNRHCRCPERRRSIVRISESSANPGRLYFACDTCKFWEFWLPDIEECYNIYDFADASLHVLREMHPLPQINNDVNRRVRRLEGIVWFLGTTLAAASAVVGALVVNGWLFQPGSSV